MTSARSLLALFALLTATALLGAACDATITFSENVEASGPLLTKTFDVDTFDSIEVRDSFEAFITVGDGQRIEITANESLVDELDIRVRNGALRVGLKNGVSVRNGTLEAVIRVPELASLEVSGASSTDVTGVTLPDQRYTLSGASDLVVEGTATTVTIEASGASDADVRLDGLAEARIDLSGASSLDLQAAERVSGQMSGASNLVLPEAAEIDVETSGASSITGR